MYTNIYKIIRTPLNTKYFLIIIVMYVPVGLKQTNCAFFHSFFWGLEIKHLEKINLGGFRNKSLIQNIVQNMQAGDDKDLIRGSKKSFFPFPFGSDSRFHVIHRGSEKSLFLFG